MKTGMTQKEFAASFGVPLSTLRKWEQGEASPPPYVVEMLAKSVPGTDLSLKTIKGTDGKKYYYDSLKKQVLDSAGNRISVKEDLEGVKERNLSLYITELFETFYEIQNKFDRDCRYDKENDIIWV